MIPASLVAVGVRGDAPGRTGLGHRLLVVQPGQRLVRLQLRPQPHRGHRAAEDPGDEIASRAPGARAEQVTDHDSRQAHSDDPTPITVAVPLPALTLHHCRCSVPPLLVTTVPITVAVVFDAPFVPQFTLVERLM